MRDHIWFRMSLAPSLLFLHLLDPLYLEKQRRDNAQAYVMFQSHFSNFFFFLSVSAPFRSFFIQKFIYLEMRWVASSFLFQQVFFFSVNAFQILSACRPPNTYTLQGHRLPCALLTGRIFDSFKLNTAKERSKVSSVFLFLYCQKTAQKPYFSLD